MRIYWFILAAYICSFSSVSSQSRNTYLGEQNNLFLAGVELRVGMQKQPILEDISKNYALVPVYKDVYLIVIKNSDPAETIGTIIFENDRLISASKSWGHGYGQDAFKILNSLYYLFSNLNKKGMKQSVILLSEIHAPQLNSKSIDFTFGQRTITISIFEIRNNSVQVSIDEKISK